LGPVAGRRLLGAARREFGLGQRGTRLRDLVPPALDLLLDVGELGAILADLLVPLRSPPAEQLELPVHLVPAELDELPRVGRGDPLALVDERPQLGVAGQPVVSVLAATALVRGAVLAQVGN